MLKVLISVYLFVGVLLTLYSATYVMAKGRSGYMKAFSALAFCISVYLLGYLLEINTTYLDEMLFWNQVQYFGLPFASGFWLMVALLYTKRFKTMGGWIPVLLFFIPAVTFILRLTNDYHLFLYKSYEIKQVYGFSLLYLKKGPWYYISVIYIMANLIITNILYYNEYRKSSRYGKSRFQLLFYASMFPYLGLIFILVDFNRLGIDYAALFLPVSLIFIMYAIFKYDFLEIRALARETIFENSTDGMLVLDKEWRIMDYNKTAADFFAAQNISLDNYFLESTLGQRPELLEIFKSETMREYHCRVQGEEKYFEISSVIIGSSLEKKAGVLKSIRDITEKKRAEEKLKILATVDCLSGLHNRAEFLRLSQQELERAKRFFQVFSLLMMDIDHFKKINDTWGHAAGDAVIREMGNLIRKSFRKTDIAGRLGGEEFAILLTGTPLREAQAVAEQFRKIVEKTKVIFDGKDGREELSVTVSIGVAPFCHGVEEIDLILKFADEALYRSKAKGRNCVTVYEAGSL